MPKPDVASLRCLVAVVHDKHLPAVGLWHKGLLGLVESLLFKKRANIDTVRPDIKGQGAALGRPTHGITLESAGALSKGPNSLLLDAI